jgi:nicotinate-nucleotide adenylyltransferase
VTGILGGTFDPVHAGHLAAAEALRDAAGLQAVWLMPNAQPPHRPPPAAVASDRLEMVRRATAGRAGLQTSDLEVRRGGVSYTVDTARELSRRFPMVRFAWLVGSDEARAIRTWREPESLMEAIDFVVFNRPGVTVTADELLALGFRQARMRLVTIQTPSIAAHEIREALHHRRSVDGLVPAAVLAYIEERGLYR